MCIKPKLWFWFLCEVVLPHFVAIPWLWWLSFLHLFASSHQNCVGKLDWTCVDISLRVEIYLEMLGYKADDYVMVIIVEDNKDCCKGFCSLWLLDCCSLLASDTLASLLFLSQSRHASHLGPLFWRFPGICSDNRSSSLKALLKFYLFHEAFLFFCYLWVRLTAF